MINIFKILFEKLTEPLGLPVSPIFEYVILALIGLIAFILAYCIVGDMYHRGMIYGRMEGSLFHWSIRFLLFFVLWLVVCAIIQGYFFATANWHLFKMIVLSMACAGLLWSITKIAVIIMKAYGGEQ